MDSKMSFENLKLEKPLSASTINAIKKLDFCQPTPVQAMCIPLILSRKDVVAEAVTGSGKTLAFLIPVIEILLRREEKLKMFEVGAVIVTPTRELAQQISHVCTYFTEGTDLSQILLIGGVSIKINVRDFKKHGGNIVITTPGRFLALLQKEENGCELAKSVKALEILILDEADRLLAQSSMTVDLNSILSYLPKQRRTSLFSATQTDTVESFIRAGLRNPVQVIVREKVTGTKENIKQIKRTPDSLQNYYLISEGNLKFGKLVEFLRTYRNDKNIVFFNTCACVDYFSKLLAIILKTIPVISIHGQMKQKRKEVFQNFHNMSNGILVCSDVMARGVDFPKVNWVIQYDPPSNAQVFVHRCGRTARMGNIGNAIIFLLPNESAYVDFISVNQKVPLEAFTEISDEVPALKRKIQKLARNDRDLYDKGIRAFVSYIQSYRKHECSIIFQLKELDICKLADGFGLIHLPKMPELSRLDLSSFVPFIVDTDTIRYKDKTREKQRQIKLEARKSASDVTSHENARRSKSWSLQKQTREKKMERREKKKRKRENDEPNEDVDDLLKEGRLLKKLKKGKITETEFEKRTGIEIIESNIEKSEKGEISDCEVDK